MSETALWLLYLLSGAAAFAVVYRLGSRIVPATLVGTAVTVAGWLLLYLLTDEKNRPDWISVDLSLNACFGLIFAGAGAALGQFMLFRQRGG